MRWIESSGGPLILMETRYRMEWGGVDSSSDSNYSCDYDRACETAEYAATIAIPSGKAIVFGDEPNRTTVIAQSEKETLIVRWRWAPSEDVLINNLNHLKSAIFNDAETICIRFQGEDIIVFDSSLRGEEIDDYLSIKLKLGEYVLDTAMFEPDGETCMLLHRLRLIN